MKKTLSNQQLTLHLVNFLVLIGAFCPQTKAIDIDALNAVGPQRLGSGFVSMIAFSPDGKIIAAAHQTNPTTEYPYTDTVLLWDAHTQEQIGEFPVGPVRTIAFSPDGTLLALGEGGDHAGSHTIWLWDVDGRTQVGTIQSPGPYGLQSVAFSPDGTLLVSTSTQNSSTYFWDVQSLESLGTISAECQSVAFSPDGRLLVTGGNRQDTTIRLWDPQTRIQVGQLTGHLIDTYDLAFSPDGAILASAGGWEDKAVYLWDIETQQQVGLLGGHPAHVGSVAFSPDGELLASTSYWEDAVFLWDAQTQTRVGQLTDHDLSAGSSGRHEVVFSSDGKWLACSSDDGVELWAVDLFGPIASAPAPKLGEAGVYRSPILQWSPGPYAQAHDIYFGTSFDDVEDANATIGVDATYLGRQDASAYLIREPLAFTQTYFWRVDEVNGPPDYTVFKGDIWSFTTEPFSYPIENIAAASNALNEPGEGPGNTIDSSGLDENDGHSTALTDMWLGTPVDTDPVWIEYEFDHIHKLHEMWVWNYNTEEEQILGFGLKDVLIEYSQDRSEWTPLGTVKFAQAPGAVDYTANSIVDLEGVLARYVRLTVASGWNTLGRFGLSEVRFFFIPVRPRDPQPADGATTEDLNVSLRWRPGREAASHVISLGTDADAVMNAGAEISITDYPLLDLRAWNLEFGTRYYWSVTEVNEAEDPAVHVGPLWYFNTLEYDLIEDFESYRDQESLEIWATWIDGYENPDNGAIAGNDNDAETRIVYEGRQSLPVHYDNSQAAISEVTRTFDPPKDFTHGGADTLSLYHRGHSQAFEEDGDGTMTVHGAGADIWSTKDDFRYVWKRLSGDGSIVVKVDSLVNTHNFAKAGVMVRSSLMPGSSFAGVFLTAGDGVHFQARLLADVLVIDDTGMIADGQLELKAPVWLRLQRDGQSFRASFATDEAGMDWTAIPWSPRAVSMPDQVYVGLAVTSHVPGESTTAVFSSVATSGAVTGTWTAEAIGGDHPGNQPEPLYIVLEDSFGRAAPVIHSDPMVALSPSWQQWQVPLTAFDPLDLSQVMKITIGLGDSDLVGGGGRGTLYIDNIGIGHPRTAP